MEELLTKKQVAELFRCSTSCVDQFRLTQRLPFIKLGHFVRFRLMDLQTWIAERTVTRIPVNPETETP